MAIRYLTCCRLLPLLLILAAQILRADPPTIRFTPNRGQIVDMDKNARPDIRFFAEGQGVRFYVRATGISYVFLKADSASEAEFRKAISTPPVLMPATPPAPPIPPKMEGYRMDMELIGSNPDPRVTQSDP